MAKRLTITPEIKNWAKIYEFITKYFKEIGLPRQDILEILISAEEIFSNIVHHSGAKTGDDVDVLADYQLFDKVAVIIFKYGGLKFNPLKVDLPDICVPFDKREFGGLGILIIKKFTDNVEYTYSENKNILKISKKTGNL